MPHNNGVAIFLEGTMSFVWSINLSISPLLPTTLRKQINIKTFIKVHLISIRQVNRREMSKINSLRVVSMQIFFNLKIQVQ